MIAIKMSKPVGIPMASTLILTFGELVVHNNDGYEIFRCRIKDYRMSASINPYQKLRDALNNNVNTIEHSDKVEVGINVTSAYTILRVEED